MKNLRLYRKILWSIKKHIDKIQYLNKVLIMNILFDFISMQDTFINGGTEYTKVIFNSFLQQADATIFGLYDRKEIIPEALKSTIKRNIIEK